MPRLTAISLSIILLAQTLGPTALAATAETCESKGITYNCVTERVEAQTIRPVYGAGLEGATNLSNVAPSYVEWPDQIAPGRTIPKGIHVSAQFEHLAKLYASNVSANASAAEKPYYGTFTSLEQYQFASIHLLQYQVNLSPERVMNGASDLYFRSPLQWNANYTGHYVQIRETDNNGNAGTVVAASRYLAAWSEGVSRSSTKDTNDSLVLDGRLYYQLPGLFYSGKVYTIDEFVTTTGTPALALSELWVFIAEGQDIAEDRISTTRMFPGHGPAERTYRPAPDGETAQYFELGWSMRLHTGMGAGGTVNVIKGDPTYTSQTIRVRYASTAASLDGSNNPNGNIVDVVIPLRLTQAINVSVTVTPFRSFADRVANNGQGTAAATSCTWSSATPITGTINHRCHFTDANWQGQAGTHWYDVEVQFLLDAGSGCGYAVCGYVMYPVSDETLPDGNKALHVLERSGLGISTSHAVFSQPWVEIREGYQETPVDDDRSVNWLTALIGVGEVIVGAGLSFAAIAVAPWFPPVTVPLALLLGSAGIATMSLGFATVYAGTQGLPPSVVLSKDFVDPFVRFGGMLLAGAACGALLSGAGSLLGAGVGQSQATVGNPGLQGARIGAATLGANALLGAECAAGAALAAGGIDGLMQFAVDLVKIVKAAVEILGLILTDLASFMAEFLGAAAPWVRAAFVLCIVLTALWFVREALLWVLNLMWPVVQQMTPKARSHHQRLESTLEAVSVPIWDSIMYYKSWRTYRGRYWRQRFGGMPQ